MNDYLPYLIHCVTISVQKHSMTKIFPMSNNQFYFSKVFILLLFSKFLNFLILKWLLHSATRLTIF